MPRASTTVGILMPDHTFRRVVGQVDLRRLEEHPRIELLADRPLDLEDPQDRLLLERTQLLITGWGTALIDARTLELMPALEAISHSAGTVRPIIDPVVYERGIAVGSAASANAIPVADYTIALITLGAKHAFWAAQQLREGAAEVDLEAAWPAVGIRSRTVGVIGASTIGRLVMRRLAALEMDVLLADPTVTAERSAELGAELVTLGELAERSDIISVHAPALPSTRGMIDRRLIESMRPGTTLINTARGELIDQDALADRLERGDLMALLDVAEHEPLPQSSRLRTSPNAFITPHIAGSLGTELGRLSAHAVDEAITYARTGAFSEPITAADFALRA